MNLFKILFRCKFNWAHDFTEWQSVVNESVFLTTGNEIKLRIEGRRCSNCKRTEWKTEEIIPKISNAPEEDW